MIKPLLFLIHRVFNTFSGKKRLTFWEIFNWCEFHLFSLKRWEIRFLTLKTGVDLYMRSTYTRVNTVIIIINGIKSKIHPSADWWKMRAQTSICKYSLWVCNLMSYCTHSPIQPSLAMGSTSDDTREIEGSHLKIKQCLCEQPILQQ